MRRKAIKKPFPVNIFDKNFDLVETIQTNEINIKEKIWNLKNPKVTKKNLTESREASLILETNFDKEKINSLFSNLSSLSFIGLNNLKNDYEQVGYSTKEIEIHFQKIFSYPFFLTVMSLFAGIIMININFNKPKIFYFILGILLSVIIYFFNYFFYSLAQTNKIPIVISIWSPISVLFIGSFIGIIRSNEK